MLDERLIEQAKSALMRMGKKRALVRLEEMEEGIYLSIYDTLEDSPRLLVLDEHPYIFPDWKMAEQALSKMMGLRRRSDKPKRKIKVERITLTQNAANAD